MHLTSCDERGLALGERDPLVVRAIDPTVSLKSEEDLTEACLVRADDTPGSK